MRLDDGWSILEIFKAGSLSVFSILLIAIMGGALLPVVGHFLLDMLLWFALSLLLALAYVRTAYAFRRRLAAQTGEAVNLLATLSDVACEVLALLGGGFFGVLCASLAWEEYRKTGEFGGHVPLMTAFSLIGLGASVVSLIKFGRYLRTDMTMRGPDPR